MTGLLLAGAFVLIVVALLGLISGAASVPPPGSRAIPPPPSGRVPDCFTTQ